MCCCWLVTAMVFKVIKGIKMCPSIYELEIYRHHQTKQQCQGAQQVPKKSFECCRVQQKHIPSCIRAWMGLNHWAVPLTCRVRFHIRHACRWSANLLLNCVFQNKRIPLSSSLCRWRARRGTSKHPHMRRGNCGSKLLRARSLPACSPVRA